jgi:DNA-binding transcriptional LysR family regulator
MDVFGEMRAFVSVVEGQSFSAAAASLGLTSSAVSKLVSKLEDRLGVRLLQRTTRRLSMTPEGETYFARARQIIAEIAEVEAEVTRARGAPRGRLRVNASTAFGIHQLAPALPEFQARYPEITLELSIDDHVIDLIADRADIAIRGGAVTDPGLIARKIADFERTICEAPDYLARRGVPRTPQDLTQHDLIVMALPVLPGWPFRERDGIQTIPLAPRVITDSSDAAIRLAIAGAGIVRLADLVLAEPIQQGRLVPILTDVHHIDPRPMSAVYLAGRHRLPKMRAFLDFVMERFAHAPWRSPRPPG